MAEPQEDDDTRGRFEEFTASPAWRALPLQIKLWVVHLWRAEHDPPKADAGSPPNDN